MAQESQSCFWDKTIDTQIYMILEKMVEAGLANDIPTLECFRGMTIDDQLYVIYANIKSVE